MMRRGRGATGSFLLLLLALAACGGRAGEPPGDEGPSRVAVVAPAAAEMLARLGLLDRVVGIGEFGPWPAAIRDLPVVGGYADANAEVLLELDCRLLVTTASEAASPVHARLRAAGIEVLALDTSTFDGVFAALREVGRTFGREAAAADAERDIRDELDALRRIGSGLPRRRVLFVVGRDPLYAAGPGSHVDEMIRLVGGENVAGDALAPYQQMSVEVLLERAPEVIIDTSDNRPGAPRGRAAGAWGRWPFLPAVRDDRVYQVDPGRLVIPGVRLPEMTRLVGRLVHPEAFGEPSTEELGARDVP